MFKICLCLWYILGSYLFITKVEINLGDSLKIFFEFHSRMPGLLSVHLIPKFLFEIYLMSTPGGISLPIF